MTINPTLANDGEVAGIKVRLLVRDDFPLHRKQNEKKNKYG